jgi:hypothetical protein
MFTVFCWWGWSWRSCWLVLALAIVFLTVEVVRKKKSHFFVEQKPTVWSVLVLCSDGGG